GPELPPRRDGLPQGLPLPGRAPFPHGRFVRPVSGAAVTAAIHDPGPGNARFVGDRSLPCRQRTDRRDRKRGQPLRQAAGAVLAATRSPHRPGLAPALGLRAGGPEHGTADRFRKETNHALEGMASELAEPARGGPAGPDGRTTTARPAAGPGT